MRKQLRHVAQSRLCLLSAHRTAEEADLMQFGTLKIILMEQVPPLLPPPPSPSLPSRATVARTKISLSSVVCVVCVCVAFGPCARRGV